VGIARDGVGARVGEQLLVVVVAERLIPARLAPQAGSAGARTGGVEGGGVAVGDVLLAVVAADEQPAEGADDGLDEVPGVEGVEEGAEAKGPALVAGCVGQEGGAGFGGDDGGAVDVVFLPGEGEEVQDGEEGHLDAEQHAWDADFDVRGGEAGGGFDGAGGGEEGDEELLGGGAEG